jgi:hypothetical protein
VHTSLVTPVLAVDFSAALAERPRRDQTWTFAETNGNGRDAPQAVIRATAVKPTFLVGKK